MKADGTPLHGSYFELAAAKHPDLKHPASDRRNKRLKGLRPSGARSRGGRFGTLAIVLCGALFGVAWLVIALKPEENVRLAVESKDLAARRQPDPPRRAAVPVQEKRVAEPPVPPAGGGVPATAAIRPEEEVRRAPSRVTTPATRPSGRRETAASVNRGTGARSPQRRPAGPPAAVPARKIFAPPPEYPDAARRAGEQGTVVVEADVDATGAVTATRVVRGYSPALDAAAAATLGTWRFEPARRGDAAIASTYRVGIRFTLGEEAAAPPQPSPRVDAGETEPSGPFEVGGEVEPPRRLTAPLPAYPDAAWAQGITGDVLVRAVIDENGDVADVEVVKSLPYGMTEAAVEAIRRWKFAPATRRGQPVAVFRNLSVRFEG